MYRSTANSAKQCYTCATAGSCNSLVKQNCNNATANATTNWLKGLNAKVPNVTNYDYFGCMNLTYNASSNSSSTWSLYDDETNRNPFTDTRTTYLGCYYQQIPVCSLNLSVRTTSCKTCSSDLCNRNPAGTLSRSTNTIISAVVVVMLAGVFNMKSVWILIIISNMSLHIHNI